MNSNTRRIVRFTGAGLVAAGATVAFSTPALAMTPPGPQAPAPHGYRVQAPAPSGSGESGGSVASGSSAADIDWSSLLAGLGAGIALTGAVALGGVEVRRHRQQPHPA